LPRARALIVGFVSREFAREMHARATDGYGARNPPDF